VDDIAFSLAGSSNLATWSETSLAFVTNSFLGSGSYEYLFRTTNPIASQPQKFIRLSSEQTP
jgi:hypothetical protein